MATTMELLSYTSPCDNADRIAARLSLVRRLPPRNLAVCSSSVDSKQDMSHGSSSCSSINSPKHSQQQQPPPRGRLDRKRRNGSLTTMHKSLRTKENRSNEEDDTVVTSNSSSPEPEVGRLRATRMDGCAALDDVRIMSSPSSSSSSSPSRTVENTSVVGVSVEAKVSQLLPRTEPDDSWSYANGAEDEDGSVACSSSSTCSDTATSTTSTVIRRRYVRFADESGLPIETIHETEMFEGEEDLRPRRLIVLLLNPTHRKFEFVHASYRRLERTTLADVLMQLPQLATNPVLSQQVYTGLCRPRLGCQEMINQVAVQNCRLGQDEVLVAMIDGYSGKDLVKIALPIFSSRRIVKAVKEAKRSGRAVKLLKSGVSEVHHRDNKKKEEKHPNHSKNSSTNDNTVVPSSPTTSMLSSSSPSSPPSLEDAMLPPSLRLNQVATTSSSFDKVLEVSHVTVAEEPSIQALTRLLNAGLAVTIVVLYLLSLPRS